MGLSPRFRFIDLLAIVLAFALLFSLAAPTILRLCNSSRGTTCQANLKTLAMSCADFETTFGSFPPAVVNFGDSRPWISTGQENGMTHAGPNWVLQMAGHLGEDQLQRDIVIYLEQNRDNEFNVADADEYFGYGVVLFPPRGTPDYLVCPAATPIQLFHTSPRTNLENLPKGNYAACLGTGTYLESIDGSPQVDAILAGRHATEPRGSKIPPDVARRGIISIRALPLKDPRDDPFGPFTRPVAFRSHRRDNDRQPSAAMTDNGSTIPVSNRGLWQLGHGKGTKVRKVRDGLGNTIMLSEVLPVDGQGTVMKSSDDLRGVWVTPSMGGSTYSHFTTPNSKVKDRINGCEVDARDLPSGRRLECVEQSATGTAAGDTFAAARSQHIGGVFAATADGAVHFYSNEISPSVWSALATRQGQD